MADSTPPNTPLGQPYPAAPDAAGDRKGYRAWFLAEVARGKRSAAAGLFAAPEQVAAVFARYRRE